MVDPKNPDDLVGVDIGRPLIRFSSSDKHADLDGNGCFNIGEAVYADETNPGVVSVGDIRLVNPLVDGRFSTVGENAPDLGTPLIVFKGDERFHDSDKNGRLNFGLDHMVI